MRRLSLAICSFFTLSTVVRADDDVRSGATRMQTDEIVQLSTPFVQARAEHVTRLVVRAPSPQGYEADERLIRGIETISYPSSVGPLKGWLWRARGRGPKPALVYFHGGFAFGLEDILACAPFVEAGFTVFAPTFRGENGNPGAHELFYGEVDDAARAVRWLAARSDIDDEQIHTFGHSSGGVISGFMSLLPDLPIASTGSAGGVYPEQLFAQLDHVPFDRDDPIERRLRGFVHHLGSMQRSHTAWVGRGDWLAHWVPELRADAESARAPMTLHIIDGNHFTSLDAALSAYLAQIRAR